MNVSGKINVLHVILSLDCGGAERFVIELSRFLNSTGMFSCSICCLKEPGDFSGDATASGIKVTSLGKKPGRDISMVLKIARLIKKGGIDIVHTHNMPPLIYGSLAVRLSRGAAAINTRHGRADKTAPAFVWDLNDYITAISRDAASELLRNNRISAGKARVIHNGIDTAPAQVYERPEEIRRTLGLDSGCCVIGTAGRLSAEKNHRGLIEAFELIGDRKTALVIVGDGREMDPLREYAAEKASGSRVIFAGFKKNINDYLSAMDVFVLPSFMEGLSLTLLEAMKERLPVIATDVGGNREVVVDGVNGFLVPAGDPRAIADAAGKLIRDPGLRGSMGREGFKRVREDFSLRSMSEKYMSLYSMMLKRRNNPKTSAHPERWMRIPEAV